MLKARPLTKEQVRDEARPVFNKVFEIDQTSPLPTLPVFVNRAILCPINFKLGEDELYSLSKAIREIGDSGFYLSMLERLKDPDWNQDWWIPIDNIGAYGELNSIWGLLENTMYSPSRQWGIVFTTDPYAIIGGTDLFMTAFFNHSRRSAEEHLQAFIGECKYIRDELGHKLEILPKLLSTIFGPQKALTLMAENELP